MTEQILVRRDHNGVILHYYPDRLMPHHTERKRYPADRERSIVIAAERELLNLRTIADNSDYSEFALERIYKALNTLQCGLEMIRDRLGMSTHGALHGASHVLTECPQ